jgi:preprotein translocase subunit SecG
MNTLKAVLPYLQIAVSVLLIAVILLQQRGTGLGGVFGGEGGAYHTKRGIEKFLFIGTIVLSALFFVVGIFSLILG